ncbi:MAG: carboxypeptidase-like regulatory domain-containing protein [Acidobacteriota bacterium]
MRRAVGIAVVSACCALVPVTVSAQAAITGVVKDPSGAVLPGVTVETASPALIEKVRSVVTDGTGQYRIVDLRPGTYAVTFTLTGFSPIKREGIELTGSFVATVNADLRVGSVEETVTVTGASPIVDVQSVKRQQTLSGDIIQAIPSARVYHSLMALVPGISLSGTSDVGGVGGPAVITFSMHGGRLSEGRIQLDGISTGAAVGGSGTSYYVVDVGNAQEVTFSTSGGMGEAETGGPVMNVVPRQGGNSIKGSLFATGANTTSRSTWSSPVRSTVIGSTSSISASRRSCDSAGRGRRWESTSRLRDKSFVRSVRLQPDRDRLRHINRLERRRTGIWITYFVSRWTQHFA